MKRIMKITVVICASLIISGCINCYLRCPATDQKIDEVYKSTKAGAGISYVVMFPQIMNPAETRGFQPMNILSIPVGCLCFADVACEAVLDTVFFPVDWWLAEARESN